MTGNLDMTAMRLLNRIHMYGQKDDVNITNKLGQGKPKSCEMLKEHLFATKGEKVNW